MGHTYDICRNSYAHYNSLWRHINKLHKEKAKGGSLGTEFDHSNAETSSSRGTSTSEMSDASNGEQFECERPFWIVMRASALAFLINSDKEVHDTFREFFIDGDYSAAIRAASNDHAEKLKQVCFDILAPTLAAIEALQNTQFYSDISAKQSGFHVNGVNEQVMRKGS